MDHLIGQRFSLISKSEIRYVGTLHEINAQESTIALEEVFSFGTEDRQVENFIPPSSQKFDYIIFRGSDVKDIKLAEEEKENKPPTPPQVPNDPAILNSQRPGPPQSNRGESPFPQPGFPQPGGPAPYPGFYPPPPPQFGGRGYGPPPPGAFGPGPGYGYPPPPPGYFGPPGQGFGPGPDQFPRQPPAPIGPPGQRPQHNQQPPVPPSDPTPAQTSELPVEKATGKEDRKTPVPAAAPTSTSTKAQPPGHVPTGPSGKAAPQKNNRVIPAMPFTVNQRTFTPPVNNDAPAATSNGPSKQAPSQAAMDEASRQAKEAVAAAMAKLNPPTAGHASAPATQASVDALAVKVGEMSTGNPNYRGRGGYRGGRGQRTSSGGQRQKMEIPTSDFDFESANAKFNKEDMIKEAIASGSPMGETPLEISDENVHSNGTPARKDSLNQPPAYNKSTSFFDNISSESKDREDSERPNGRAMRSQEFKKNVETFGQGNVDSGYRGRGGYRGRRGGRGYRGGYHRGGRGQAQQTAI